MVATTAGGTVLVKLPGTSKFVALRPGQELPYGTEIDTRKGRVTLTSIPKAGAPAETAVFYDGLFKISYAGGVTNLTLTEPLAACPRKGRASTAAKKAKSRKLWGKGKGAFRTTGRYSAATVRGTDLARPGHLRGDAHARHRGHRRGEGRQEDRGRARRQAVPAKPR